MEKGRDESKIQVVHRLDGKGMTCGCESIKVNEAHLLAPQSETLHSLARAAADIENYSRIDDIAAGDNTVLVSEQIECQSSSFRCFKPFTTIEIHTDGNCTFCCFIRRKIGNINGATIETVFNSETAQEIRKNFYRNDYSDCDKSRCNLFAVGNIRLRSTLQEGYP